MNNYLGGLQVKFFVWAYIYYDSSKASGDFVFCCFTSQVNS